MIQIDADEKKKSEIDIVLYSKWSTKRRTHGKIQKKLKHIKKAKQFLHMSKLSSIWDNRENESIVKKIILDHISKFMKEQFPIREAE